MSGCQWLRAALCGPLCRIHAEVFVGQATRDDVMTAAMRGRSMPLAALGDVRAAPLDAHDQAPLDAALPPHAGLPDHSQPDLGVLLAQRVA